VEEVKAIGTPVPMASIERLDACPGSREQRFVVGHLGRERIGEIAEDGEVDPGIQIAERQDLHVLDQLGDL
jgi:hypothetical protein